jgi:hypothetical protein
VAVDQKWSASSFKVAIQLLQAISALTPEAIEAKTAAKIELRTKIRPLN